MAPIRPPAPVRDTAALGPALVAGGLYFATVFGAGFVLGVVRTGLVAPRLGELPAVLLELPVILGIAWIACAALLRRRPLPMRGAVLMGGLAFVLLMLAEAGVSTALAGRSLAAHLALYAQPAHLAGLAGQLLFAAFPALQVRRHRAPAMLSR